MAERSTTTRNLEQQDRSTRIKGSIAQLKQKVFPGLKYSLIISLIFNFVTLIIGALNVHKCQVKPQIPIFLIVIGCSGIISHIVTFIKDRPTLQEQTIIKHIESILYFTSLIFLILGSYWVYSIFKPSFNPNDGFKYCNKTAYMFAFIYLTIIWTIILALLLGFACFLCCICFAAATSEQFVIDIENAPSNNQTTQPLNSTD